MSQARPADIESGRFIQLTLDLTQATSVDSAVRMCLPLLDDLFAPRAISLHAMASRLSLWEMGDVLQSLPQEADLHWLSAGEVVTQGDEEQTSSYLIPLRAAGSTIGWLTLNEPRWSNASSHAALLLGSTLGPVLSQFIGSDQQEQVAQLRTLTEIGRALSGMLDLETLIGAIYDATRQVLDAPSFFIGLFDPQTAGLEVAYAMRDGKRIADRPRWSVREGLASIIYRTRAPLRTDDYLLECARQGVTPRPLGSIPLNGAWIGVPMLAHDRFVGIINVTSQRPGYRYRPEHAEILQVIASQAAVAIENARLYQRAEHQARQLAALNRIGRSINSSLDAERVPSLIVEQVCELLEVEEGSLLLEDSQTRELVFAYANGPIGSQLLGQRLPYGVGVAGSVMVQGESLIVNDAQGDERFYRDTDRSTGYTTRALLVVPLRAVGGVHGVIEVMNRRDGTPFTDDDRQLLEAIADQAVIALENAQKFAQIDEALARRAQELGRSNERLQHNLRSLTALNALGMAINSTLRSPEEIYGMTASGVMELSQALSAVVMLATDDGRFDIALRRGVSVYYDASEMLARHVLLSGRPERLQIDALPAQAVLAVPLRATRRTLGVLLVFYPDQVPDSSDQETIVLFAAQAASAVESLALFTEVRGARDEMASILASIREGIMLIAQESQIALANSSFHEICGVAFESPFRVDSFLTAWEQTQAYALGEWQELRTGLARVTQGLQPFASGELNANGTGRSVEWAAMPAHSGGQAVGAILVLRDISEAKEAERLRNDLTNMIIHDLRSPLSSVLASLSLLMRGISGELTDMQQHVLKIANSSSLQMLDMVNTLLDISRLEGGHLPLNSQLVPPVLLAERATARISPIAHENNITLSIDVSEDLAPLLVDSELIVRVLQNLIANAVKFSAEYGVVRVYACDTLPPAFESSEDGTWLCLAVNDRGIGIATKDQEKIFTKFGQVGERRGGTGLGLTFCKLAVEAHGGRIWVESAPGQGSTFYFTVPVASQSLLIP